MNKAMKEQFEGSGLQDLMESQGRTICDRCYCCDAVTEMVYCWQCGGFPDEDEDGYECPVCHDEGSLPHRMCLGRCDAEGNHAGGGAMNKYQLLLDRCTGPAPKPCMKPKAMTGIERNQLERLDHIEAEYQQTFGGKQEV